MANAKYFPTNVRAWCVVKPFGEKPIEVPAVSIELVFPLNAIPEGSVSLAVGRNAANPNELSTVHKLVPHLKRGTVIELWCKLEGTAGMLEGVEVSWPKDAFRIFDGKITTAAPEIGNGLRVSIGVKHWLGDMDQTCWLSCMLDPGSGFAIQSPATHPQMGRSGNQGMPNRGIWFLDLAGRGPAASYAEDLWVKGVKPTLISLANNENEVNTALKLNSSFLTGLNMPAKPNENALAALRRMDDVNHMPVTPLPLFGGVQAGTVQGNESLAGAVANYTLHLASQMWSPEGSYTLWSKLLRFAKFGSMAIVPGVETATMIPWMPVGATPWITLNPEDVWSFVMSVQIPRQHRGIALLVRGHSPWMARADTVAGRKGIIGFYDVLQNGSGFPADLVGNDPGTLIVTYAPPWLDPHGYSQRAASTLGGAIGWVGDDGKRVIAKDPPPPTMVGDAWAKAAFFADVFKMRGGALTTRLRFDIAPGSMITFKDFNSDYDVPGFTGAGMTANVSAVTIKISSQPGQCGTTLNLNHARMAHESSVALDKHPLFGNAWIGGPLVNLSGVTPSWQTPAQAAVAAANAAPTSGTVGTTSPETFTNIRSAS